MPAHDRTEGEGIRAAHEPLDVTAADGRTASSFSTGPSAAAEAAAVPAPPRRQSLPEYGLSLAEVEAATISPTKAGAPKGKKRALPRELRNLALPDRDWNVAMPFFSVDLATKTRDQFGASAETHVVLAAREHHERLVVSKPQAGSDDTGHNTPIPRSAD